MNQASSGEPMFPSIQNPVPVYPHREEPRASSGKEIVYTPLPPQRIHAQADHTFYPEQIYIASVISMCSPAERREFKHHCITQLTNQTWPNLVFQHDLREIEHITTSTIHFQNLLWRWSVNIANNNITESFSWIRRCTLQGQPDQTYLESSYHVVYYYGHNKLTVYQVRNLWITRRELTKEEKEDSSVSWSPLFQYWQQLLICLLE